MVWVRFPGEKLSPISNPKHLEFPRFSGSEEEADEEWNGLGDEEQDQKRWRWCVGRRCFFFFGWFGDCLLLYNLCTVYIYIHIHCIYLCFFGVGGRLGMNPRILTCKGVDPSLSMYFPQWMYNKLSVKRTTKTKGSTRFGDVIIGLNLPKMDYEYIMT